MTTPPNPDKQHSLIGPDNLPGLLSRVVNVKPEEDEHVARLANDKNVVLIGFIAPYVAVRVSPVEEARPFIGLPDEFGIEALIAEVSRAETENAYLLVNSPGGAMNSSYKIARAIRATFKNITTFVPHVAASGGTLLALVGNEIVMGPMSYLTPLDVQIRYKGGLISATTFMKFFSRALQWFEKTGPEEAPYPRKALADKLDPFLMEEWSGLTDIAIDYVEDILQLGAYENAREIAERLVMGFSSHDYVINYDRALEIGLNAKNGADADFQATWQIIRHWLSKYMFAPEMTHCIRYAIPGGKEQHRDTAQVEAKDAAKK